MTALIIIGAILTVFAIIGITRLKFRVAYIDDDIVAVAQVWFIKFRVYPKKKRKVDPKDFKIKRFKRRIKGNVKRAETKVKKKRLKAEKKKNKKKARDPNASVSEPNAKKKRAIKPLVRLLLRIIKVFIKKFPKYLQVTVSRLVIGVGSDDAANTAITYGYAVQTVQYIISYIKLNSNLQQTKKAVISVYPDFTAVKSRLELDVTMSIRVWQLVALGIALVIAYLNKGDNQKEQVS